MELAATTAVPFDRVAWPRTTDRLRLRRARRDDGAKVFAYRRQDVVAHWLSQLQNDPVAWAGRWEERIATTMIVERDGQVIGDARLILTHAHAQHEVVGAALGSEAEIMWAFDPAFHGQGYASEAVGALIILGLEELGLRRLTACCYADNVASWRLMERVGMRREGHQVRSARHRDGTWRDFLSYALLAPGA